MKKLDWATFIGIVITIPSLITAMMLMQPEMPKPPDFTKAEMQQRVLDFVADHMATCKECGDVWHPELGETLEFLCNHNIAARERALTVGNWKYTWRGWMWVGKPYPNYEWSVRQQKWCKIVADGRKLKGS